MVIRQKKYEAGEAVRYITRRGALKKLQVTLKQFRTLCILKGVYPREPIKRKRAQRGKPGVKILYYRKDINFLLHEPNLVIMRQQRALFEKLKSKKEQHDHIAKKKLKTNFPHVKLDHIVKERYPTFLDALRDLDDALTLCILLGRMPGLRRQRLGMDKGLMELCSRLPLEFMHAVIHARALRKVFVSIKGFYFQAEFKGQKVTWIIPHLYGHQPYDKKQIDIRTMLTFAEFYTSLLGFTLYRLYHSLNLAYPPVFANFRSLPVHDKELVDDEVLHEERVAALNLPLAATGSEGAHDQEEEEGGEFDYFPTNSEADAEKMENFKREAEKVRALKRLFSGLRIFLNREVPREPLTLALRSFGAQVSWDRDMFVGATFSEDDETITHQIVDRPSLGKQYISRYYVQPQWVFDSINSKQLAPVEKYFMGVALPPHLSPFIDAALTEHYVPPEAEDPENERLRDPRNIQTLSKVRKGPRQARQLQEEEAKRRAEEVEREELENAKKCSDTEEEEEEERSDVVEGKSDVQEGESDVELGESDVEDGENDVQDGESDVQDGESDVAMLDDEEEEGLEGEEEDGDAVKAAEKEALRKEMKKKMAVKPGKETPVDPAAAKIENYRQRKMAERMIPNKYKRLYKIMMDGRKKRVKELNHLKLKRYTLDELKEEQEKAEREKVIEAQAAK